MSVASRARWGTAMLFSVDGIGFGVWAAHIPVFRDALHLSSSGLSVVLLALVIGSIVSMPVAGAVIQRMGSRPVIWTAVTVYLCAVVGLAQVGSFGTFVVFAAVFGAAKGALDVAINAQGVWVERQLGTPVVSSFQGFWSLGGLFGAGASSWALRHGGGIRSDFLVTAGVLLVCTLAGVPFLLVEKVEAKVRGAGGGFRADPQLLRLAGVAFLGLFCEGAMSDWDGVFLKSSVGVSLSQAAIGYAAFSVSMAAGRFAGDALIARFPARTILRVSGMLLFLGVAVALGFNTWAAAIAGFVCAGFGVANIVPVIWGMAGRNESVGAGPALATVTTVGYFGFLAGPPLIGFLATLASLRVALGVVALFGVAIAASAGLAGKPTEAVAGEA